jgi:hypothetical protein
MNSASKFMRKAIKQTIANRLCFSLSVFTVKFSTLPIQPTNLNINGLARNGLRVKKGLSRSKAISTCLSNLSLLGTYADGKLFRYSPSHFDWSTKWLSKKCVSCNKFSSFCAQLVTVSFIFNHNLYRIAQHNTILKQKFHHSHEKFQARPFSSRAG